jgi:hypothetical protein
LVEIHKEYPSGLGKDLCVVEYTHLLISSFSVDEMRSEDFAKGYPVTLTLFSLLSTAILGI